MIVRLLDEILRDRLDTNAAVAMLGPRQVGKTTLAFQVSENIPSIYLDLENRTDLLKVQNITAFHSENSDKLIILDEVQRLPEVFSEIRGLIDSERRKGNKSGHFLFLGSASLELLKQSSESLAGRITYVELFPVTVLEFVHNSNETNLINTLWVRGGFPESLLAKNSITSLQWRKDFIKTYIERDIPQLGQRVPSETMERLWIMLAHSQGANLNASKLAGALDISNMSVGRYVDLLVDLLLVRKLTSYTKNVKKRLVKSQRIYIRDSGIVHALLTIEGYNALLGHPVVGKSWEGFVIENVYSILPSLARCYYYRTSGGAEIDLVIEFNDNSNELWAVEIKRSASSQLKKGFFEACQDINPTHKFIVHSQPENFLVKGDIRSVGLFDFLQMIQNKNR